MLKLALTGLLAISFISCGRITVKVGKKEKPRPEFQPTSVVEQSSVESDPDLGSFRELVNRIGEENEDKARAIILEMKDGLRGDMRSALRGLQTVIEENTKKSLQSENQIQFNPEDFDAKSLSEEIDWLDETEIFLHLQQLALRLPFDSLDVGGDIERFELDPDIQLILFDFGILMDGFFEKATVVDPDSGEVVQQMKGEILWQLVPELRDFVQGSPRISVQMKMLSLQTVNGDNSLLIELSQSPDLRQISSLDELPTYQSLRLELASRISPSLRHLIRNQGQAEQEALTPPELVLRLDLRAAQKSATGSETVQHRLAWRFQKLARAWQNALRIEFRQNDVLIQEADLSMQNGRDEPLRELLWTHFDELTDLTFLQ